MTKSWETPDEVAEAGVALVDMSLQTFAMDRGAATIVSAASGERLRCARVGLARLPASILALIGRVDRPNGRPAEMRFAVGDESYLVRASMMASHAPAMPEARILVRFQREAKAVDAVRELGIKCHLTDREKEALSGIAIGLTSKEVAQRMNIAPSTVKAFLRMIMIKTGSPNRAGIVAKLVAPAEPDDATSDEASWLAAG